MSWNGATEVASWRVLSGDDEDHLSENTEVERTGFETAADITPHGSKIVVEALDADGRHLASTRAARGEWRFGEEHIGKITGLTERSRLPDGPDFSGFSKLLHPQLSHELQQFPSFLR